MTCFTEQYERFGGETRRLTLGSSDLPEFTSRRITLGSSDRSLAPLLSPMRTARSNYTRRPDADAGCAQFFFFHFLQPGSCWVLAMERVADGTGLRDELRVNRSRASAMRGRVRESANNFWGERVADRDEPKLLQ